MMAMDSLNPSLVAEFLARIEKLPEEWRHPLARTTKQLVAGLAPYWQIALDLHIGHMAKRLASNGRTTYRIGMAWATSLDNRVFKCYEESVIASAEALAGAEPGLVR